MYDQSRFVVVPRCCGHMLGCRGVLVASNSIPMNDQLLALFHERTLLMSDYAEQVLRKVPRAEIGLDPCSLLIDGRAMRGGRQRTYLTCQ